ncbi:MAG: hypothetical protein ABGY75_11215 [Gemmataceae bacterium]
MSYCYIDSPYSYSWIAGAFGFLRVYAFNDSGAEAELVSTCTRTTDTPPSGHKLDRVTLPNDPYLVWIATYALNHKSYGYSTRHTLNTVLYDQFGGYLDSSTVVSVGVTPPDAATDMHGDPKETHPTAEHWLAKKEDADALLPLAQLVDGYLPTDGKVRTLGGAVPKTVKALRVTAELCLPKYGGPDDLPGRRQLLTATVAAGDPWELALRDADVVHGAVVMLSFTNPDEESLRRKTVTFPVSVFDSSMRVVQDAGRHKGHDGQPPLVFRLTR